MRRLFASTAGDAIDLLLWSTLVIPVNVAGVAG